MSSKFKKQQKKKRWSECGVICPAWFFQEVVELASAGDVSAELGSFGEQMQEFLGLKSTYAELECLKKMCPFVVAFAVASESQFTEGQLVPDVQVMLSTLVELLFLENSRPLHRQLLALLRPLPERYSAALGITICNRVATLAEQHLPSDWQSSHSEQASQGQQQAQPDTAVADAVAVAANGNKEAKSGVSTVPLGQALTSLLGYPAIRPFLAPSAAPAVACVSLNIKAVLNGVTASTADKPGVEDGDADSDGAALHIPPAIMEDVQDAVSALYYMLTGFGQELVKGEAGRQAVLLASDALLTALKGSVLAREALASAAVALYAAATLPTSKPQTVALHFAEGLLMPAADAARLIEERGGKGVLEGPPLSLIDAHLRQRGSSLVQELRDLPAIARICALKGLLYAMPIEVCCAPLVLVECRGSSSNGIIKGNSRPWMLLTDGAIGVLGEAISTAPDAHFKFHAVRALSVCLDRIKEALAAAGNGSRPKQPISKSGKGAVNGPGGGSAKQPWDTINGDVSAEVLEGTRLNAGPHGVDAENLGDKDGRCELPVICDRLRDKLKGILWGAWEDPLGQTVKQVHAAFSALLDIMDLQGRLAQQGNVQMPEEGSRVERKGSALGEEEKDGFLLSCAKELLTMDAVRKARYAPLATVIPRVGAHTLLQMQSHLTERSLAAMEDHVICSSVGAMLGVLWETLHAECLVQADGDKATAQTAWAEHWAPPMLAILCSSNETLRHNVAVYALPPLLQQNSEAMGHLLRELLVAVNHRNQGRAAAACVAVLKAGRSLQLLTDLHAPPVLGLDAAAIEDILQRTVVDESENIRVDTLQLVCVHPKTTSLPTPLELRTISKFVSLTLRCPSTSLRNKFLSLMRKLLARMRVGVAAVINKPSHQQNGEQMEGVARQQRWLQWFSNTLMASLYPGAPFARTFMAVELVNVLLETFGDLIVPDYVALLFCSGCEARLPPGSFSPFCPGFVSNGMVALLLGAAVDTWDKLREGASMALMRLPTPLPGLEKGAQVEGLLERALLLVNSPRLGESDAGAKLVLLVFKKYVVQLGWTVTLRPATTEGILSVKSLVEGLGTHGQNSTMGRTLNNPKPNVPGHCSQQAVLHFLEGACGLLEACINAGKRDMLVACRNSLAHGAQITLRYLVAEVAWGQLAQQAQHVERARIFLCRLLTLVYDAAALVMGPLSRPQEQNVGAGDVEADDVDSGDVDLAADSAVESEARTAGLGPKAQVILTGCWLTMKECSLLLGTLARTVPLTGSEKLASLLNSTQLKAMGDHFVRTLCLMKHNGAIEKTQAGFIALCERLLRESSPDLNTLPQQWLSTLLGFLQRPGQCRSDIVRRSAGLPFAINALFIAEPGNTHKILMNRGMEELLCLAGASDLPEPWPQVHALNVLRVAYNDASLACDTSAYYARGVEVSLVAMAAQQWEVRNAATLCYTALLVRILGFRNTATRDAAAKRAMTGADFFAQYPTLHPFLLAQLQLATEQLESGRGSVMHPSLFPVLALLARLRPSLHSRHAQFTNTASLSPAAFATLVRRCAAAEPFAVRQLAARALVPLLPPAELAGATGDLATDVAEAICGSTSRACTSGMAGSCRPAVNAVHGWLLQLRLLIEGAGESDDGAANELAPGVAQVAAQLRRCEGVCALGHYGCAPLSLEYLKVIRAMLSMAQQAKHVDSAPQQAQHDLSTSVAQFCWQAIVRSLTVEDEDSRNPMTSAAYKVATELYFGHLREYRRATGCTGVSGLVLSEEVEQALRSLKYEVRCATLKQLVKLLSAQRAQHDELDEPALCALRAVLLLHLAREQHHKGVRRTLFLLSLLPPSPIQTPSESSPVAAEAASCTREAEAIQLCSMAGERLFAELLHRAQSEADSAIKQYAVRSLGQLLQPLLGAAVTAACASAENNASTAAAASVPSDVAVQHAQLESFVSVLEDCSQSWQLPELRWAAVAALESSGLLSIQPSSRKVSAVTAASPISNSGGLLADSFQAIPIWLVKVVVAGWAVAVRLLEEEDADIRNAMAAVAAASTVANSSPSYIEERADASAEMAGQSIHSSGSVAQRGTVEWVEREVFATLSFRFGAHPAFISQLCFWVYEPWEGVEDPEGEGEESYMGGSAQGAIGGRRLFDKELDNHHEEPLLIAQLAANALSSLSTTLDAESEAGTYVCRWASLALQHLEAAVSQQASKSFPVKAETLAADVAIPWEQYGETAGALQGGFTQMYRLLLALWVSGQIPDNSEKRSIMSTVLAQLFDVKHGSGSIVEGGLLEQPQLRSLINKVLHVWGCQQALVVPVFEATFLVEADVQE